MDMFFFIVLVYMHYARYTLKRQKSIDQFLFSLYDKFSTTGLFFWYIHTYIYIPVLTNLCLFYTFPFLLEWTKQNKLLFIKTNTQMDIIVCTILVNMYNNGYSIYFFSPKTQQILKICCYSYFLYIQM